MVGKIYKVITPYYDKTARKSGFKARPALVIMETNGYDSDCVILPVSTIKQERYRDPKYDKFIEKSKYPDLDMTENCYVRTGKQTSISRKDIGSEISDMKSEYPDLYLEVLALLEEFQKTVLDSALC